MIYYETPETFCDNARTCVHSSCIKGEDFTFLRSNLNVVLSAKILVVVFNISQTHIFSNNQGQIFRTILRINNDKGKI